MKSQLKLAEHSSGDSEIINWPTRQLAVEIKIASLPSTEKNHANNLLIAEDNDRNLVLCGSSNNRAIVFRQFPSDGC